MWYRGQPLICNFCALQGHKSANCPSKDKCRRCRETGHLTRACRNPWDNNSSVDSNMAPPVVETDAQPMGAAPAAPVLADPAASASLFLWLLMSLMLRFVLRALCALTLS